MSQALVQNVLPGSLITPQGAPSTSLEEKWRQRFVNPQSNFGANATEKGKERRGEENEGNLPPSAGSPLQDVGSRAQPPPTLGLHEPSQGAGMHPQGRIPEEFMVAESSCPPSGPPGSGARHGSRGRVSLARLTPCCLRQQCVSPWKWISVNLWISLHLHWTKYHCLSCIWCMWGIHHKVHASIPQCMLP